MDRNKCTLAGTLTKIHGYKGDLILWLKPGLSIDIEGTEMVFIEIKGLLVPFFISPENMQVRDTNSLFVRFDDVDNENIAKELLGSDVYIPGINLIKDSVNLNLSFIDYLSFRVIDKDAGELGILEEVLSISSNPVLRIINSKNEILVPAQESFLISADLKNKTIVIQVPDGLLDIYL